MALKFRNFLCSIRELKFPVRFYTEQIKLDIAAGFDDEQTIHLLKVLNTISVQELAETDIFPTAKAISFCRWRDSLGGFQHVSDMMKITGVGPTLADRLCTHILEAAGLAKDSKDKVKKPISQNSLGGCIPRISVARAHSIRSFTALDIGQNQMTWCSMSRDYSQDDNTLFITDWNRTQFLETPFVVTKHSHATLHEKMFDIVHRQLPPHVDCFITEFKRLRCPSLKFMPLILNQAIAETVLLTMLNSYNATDRTHKVVKMRPSVVTRQFGLSVGNERVSGHRIVESAIEKRPFEDTDIDSHPKPLSIELSPGALVRYKQTGELEREGFNVSFLLAVAFYEVVLQAAEKIIREI